MESLSLLKFWRGGGSPAAASTIRSAAIASPDTMRSAADTDYGDDGDDGDDGPFFDLVFAVPDSNAGAAAAAAAAGEKDEMEESEEEEERELCFSMTLPEGALLSPSETNSIVIAAAENDPKPQIAVSLLKSATRLRVFTLGLRKQKSMADAPVAATGASPEQSKQQGNFFVKFKVDDVPVVSLFSRDGSIRNSGDDAPATPEPEEKKMTAASKELVQKYLGKIKPFNVKVSKRNAEKKRLSGPLVYVGDLAGTASEVNEGEEKDTSQPPLKSQKPSRPSRLRVVYKRLGKTNSSPAAVASVASPPPQRRDDSLLQVEDGIQGAIAHCKRSFTAASKDSESPLTRSKSFPGESCRSECT